MEDLRHGRSTACKAESAANVAPVNTIVKLTEELFRRLKQGIEEVSCFYFGTDNVFARSPTRALYPNSTDLNRLGWPHLLPRPQIPANLQKPRSSVASFGKPELADMATGVSG
ncbi:unnamed protein product [Dibothriocephalus latus]|uniref:Uncharacterized protein n=1 Tax=Dibothriocephalus latus TaxID=60516 RepID=A0A3P7LLS5_DIBLA|nr:unnamed protein product [Dibothriocephalus latus]